MAFQSNWTFNVAINRPRDIEIIDEYNNLTVGPGATLTIQFLYKGGIGMGLATGFNIFCYDRSDTLTDGTPDAPEAGTEEKPIPVPFGTTPAVPLPNVPEITPALISGAAAGVISTNNVFATFISGQWVSSHKGFFQVTAPMEGYDEPITTFSGQAQITQ